MKRMKRVCGKTHLANSPSMVVALLCGFLFWCASFGQAAEVLGPLSQPLDASAQKPGSLYGSFDQLSDPDYLVHKESYGRAGPIVFNHQSALWEQVVLAVNNTETNWNALKLTVSNVKAASVYNALHEGEGTYELVHNYPVSGNGGMVKFVVEYRLDVPGNELESEPAFTFQPVLAELRKVSSLNSRPVRTTLEVQPLGVGYYSVDLPESVDVDTPVGWNLPLSPYEIGGWASVGVMLSFDAVPEKVYEIQFSDDGKNWLPALPQVRAASSLVFWIDKGSPKTPSHPMLTIIPGGIPAPVRLYRVIELE